MQQACSTFFALFTAVFLFTSCVEGLEPTTSPEANFQATWRIVDEQYCFLDYKRQELGLDWNEVYARYHPRINDQMSSSQLFEVLCEMLGELQDGHVNLQSASDLGRNWSWKEDYPKNLDEEVREGYLGTGNDYRIAGGLKYRILPDNIGYVVCESFSTPIGDAAVNVMLNYMRVCRGIVLDVRGNSGGELTNASRLASHFTNERLLTSYQMHKNGPGHQDFSQPQPVYLEPSKGVRWQKPCIVLANRSCYSATNDFVCSMKCCPLVTVLGDRTGGGSGMPFMSELPIGWYLRLSTCPILDADGRHIEFGIQPDVPCSLQDDDVRKGLDTLIEEARRLLHAS